MIIDEKYNNNDTLRSEPSLKGFKSVIIERYLNEYELFTNSNFINDNNLPTKLLKSKDANIDEYKYTHDRTKGSFNIYKEIKFDNTNIHSIRSYGLILTLYSNPDFTGNETILSDDIIYKSSLSEPAQSIKIKPKMTFKII